MLITQHIHMLTVSKYQVTLLIPMLCAVLHLKGSVPDLTKLSNVVGVHSQFLETCLSQLPRRDRQNIYRRHEI